uniref:Uncharacterized protein n=1 Tax=Glossina morsitans morsitans TaxID=37546 RepID=A0A1B0GCG0_GLOMM
MSIVNETYRKKIYFRRILYWDLSIVSAFNKSVKFKRGKFRNLYTVIVRAHQMPTGVD